MRLELNDGTSLALAPGNTWFELVNLTASATLSGASYHVTNRVLDTRTECPVPPTATPTETPIGYVAPNDTPTPTP